MTKPREVPPGQRHDLLIDPLDFLILEVLPEEGTMAFGAYPTGMTVREISKQKFNGELPSSLLSSRVRVLGYLELVVKHIGLGTGSKSVWQRTAAGKQIYDEWKAAHGNDS